MRKKNNKHSDDIVKSYSKNTNHSINHIVKQVLAPETRGRKATGHDEERKSYHRVTISMTKKQVEDVKAYAKDKELSVSTLIKKLLVNEYKNPTIEKESN